MLSWLLSSLSFHFFSFPSKISFSQFYQMILCLLVVYWHFHSDLSDLPFWCLSPLCFWAVSPPHYNCLLSLTPVWFWCCLFVFVNSKPLFSWVICCMTSSDMLHLICPAYSSSFLVCPLLFSRLVSPFPFVSIALGNFTLDVSAPRSFPSLAAWTLDPPDPVFSPLCPQFG